MRRDERHRSNPKAWATRDELAAILGVEARAVDSLRTSLGNAAEEKQDNRVRIFLPEWLRLWAAYTQASKATSGDNELDSPDADSPWLEEKRKWSAKREQAKYQQEIGELIPEADVRRGFSLVAGKIRAAAELSCDPCKDKLESALDDAETLLDAAMDDTGGETSDGNEVPSSAEASD